MCEACVFVFSATVWLVGGKGCLLKEVAEGPKESNISNISIISIIHLQVQVQVQVQVHRVLGIRY